MRCSSRSADWCGGRDAGSLDSLTMSTEPATTTGADAAAGPQPPAVQRIPAERTHHGDTFVDEYAWLADKENPETIAYLEAENAYTEAMTGAAGRAAQRDLRRDQGAHPGDRPVGADPQGRLVVLHADRRRGSSTPCTAAARSGRGRPPRRCPPTGPRWTARRSCSTATSSPAGQEFFSLGALRRQPGRAAGWPTPPTSPATSGSRCGSRTWTPARCSPDEVPGTFYGCAWSLDGSALFYVTVDEAWRPYRVLAAHGRHPGGRRRDRATRRPTSGSGSASG